MMRNRVDVRGVDPSSAGGAVSGSACGHRVAGGVQMQTETNGESR